MMEFWLENQSQSHLYSRFGTLPGRNYAQNYPERHQANCNTLYQAEQQDRGRVSSDWRVPRSRAGGAIREYSNWSEPELPGFSSPNFPFVLHPHDQRHQDLRWSSHGAVRDCDRGFLRDAWPRKWDQSQPSCHTRDVSAKRNDSSYRELEAWAARYSHSLPRRRRLEAELLEAAQGPSDSSQAPERGKRVANPGVQLQHSQLNRNSGAPGDKAKPPATDINRMKEKIAYHSRVFGKPPGYIGPPPYNRPHKSPAVVHQYDVGWQLVGSKQSDRSTFRNQDVPVDLQTKRKVEKHESKTYPDLVELESKKHKRDALQRPRPIDLLNPEGALTEEPQAAQKSTVGREEICKVIEGRKFRLKKKTGGMAIFCLVSRIASPSENPSLPVHTSQTSVRSTETGEKHSDDSKGNDHVDKLADDMDFREHTPKEQSNKKMLSCRENVMLKDDLSDNCVFLEKSGFERSMPESVEPVLTKYPLWREPSSRSEVGTERPNTNSVKENHEGGDVSGNSTENKKKKPDILENAEDVRGLLVIDTSCVVVKVEMIPSPKKEQVQYLGSTATEERKTPESYSQLYQDGTTDWNNEALQKNEDPEDELDSTLMEKREHKESGVSLSSVQPAFLSERETLEKRAERILGIPLQDDEQQTEDEEPVIDRRKEEQNEEAAPSVSGLTPEDTGEEVDVCQVEEEKEDIRKQKTNEEGKDFTESLQPAPDMTEECNTECQLETDNTSTQIDLKTDGWSESTCGESGNEDHLVDLSDSSISLNLSNSRIKECPDTEPDAQSPDLDPSSHPDASRPHVQPPSLLPDDSLLSSTISDDHLPPLLEVLVLAADVECGAESKDDEAETLLSAECVVNDESVITEMKDDLPHQQSEYHQCDDGPCIAEKKQTEECNSSRGETKHEDLNILAQQIRSEKLDLQVPNSTLSNPIFQTGKENEGNSRTCETLDNNFPHCLPKNDLEEEILCKTKRDVTPEPGQINPSLTASLLEQTGSSEGYLSCPTQLNTDTLLNSNSQGEFPDDTSSSSRSEILNKLQINDFSEREGDVVPLLPTDSTVSPVSDDIAAAPDIMEDASDPIYLGSCEESSQLTMFLPQEEGVSPAFSQSSAHKKGSQYPKSLLDVVNRIRKHTAPDSESEEEEVSEPWDPNCLEAVADTKSEENFSDDLQVVFVDSAEIRQVDQDDIESEGHAEEDTLSCSGSSHVSEDTVIVTDEERRHCGVVDKNKEESDTAEEELRCYSEEKDEIQSEDSEAEDDNLNIYGSSEDIDQLN